MIRSLLFCCVLFAVGACENHPIPNKEERGGAPAEMYEGSSAPGEVAVDPDVPAEFPGGMIAMKRWLSNQVRYPQTAVELGLEGKTYLRFTVDKNGNVRNVHVLRGVPDCAECDKEAVRAVRAMPRWIPGRKDNKAVNSTFNLPISFKLQ